MTTVTAKTRARREPNRAIARSSNFRRSRFWLGKWAIGAAALAWTGRIVAADAFAGLKPEQMFEGGTNVYNNWIELSAGGFITEGDAASAEQREHMHQGAFGGIEDLHFEEAVNKTTTFTLDGHGIFDQHDYSIKLGLAKEDLGYVKVGFENFRTWYDSAGGFFPPDNLSFSLGSDALALDRGQVTFEAGLTLKDKPKVVFKYTHWYREGDKSSTIWGPVDTSIGVSSIYPSFYHLDEKSDSFQLDVTHHIKKVDVGLGVRYETGNFDDSLMTFSFPDDPTSEKKITDRQGTSYDMLSVHAFSETWLKKNMFLSAGFMFANLDNDFTGSRVYGDDFDVPYTPDPLNGLGYFGLNGGSHKQEYVGNLNLLMIPVSSLTIVPALRVMDQNWNADSSGIGTLSDFATEPFVSNSKRDELEVRERIDIRYTAITNWVFYAGPEWTEGQGNYKANGGLTQVAGIGVSPIQQETDDSHFFQKYFVGARWYPTRGLTIDAGGYYKYNRYEYDNEVDSTPNDPLSLNRYPAYLTMQGFETYDGNVRVSIKPRQNVTLVSRYEFQYSTVLTTPDAVSGLIGVESSKMTSHIFGQNITWVPWSRLSLQVGGNLVVSDTRTPMSDFTEAVLRSENNYWTVNCNAGFVVDDRTDLNVGYFFYQSDDFNNNALAAVPYGVAQTENGVTATMSRRLSKNVRLNLRYGYDHFDDISSGGHNSYQAHLVYSSLQYRF